MNSQFRLWLLQPSFRFNVTLTFVRRLTVLCRVSFMGLCVCPGVFYAKLDPKVVSQLQNNSIGGCLFPPPKRDQNVIKHQISF